MGIKLIVNADDYGRSVGVSRGIRDAHKHGIVSSTTCLMNFDNIADDIALALEETPELGLGVHLVLTSGNPILPPNQIPTLTGEKGQFLKYEEFLARIDQIDAAQLKSEWRAQIESFIRLAGRQPTHLDSHHHAAFWSETLLHTQLELAAEYDCAIRHMAAQPDGGFNGLPWPVIEGARKYVPRLMAEFSPPAPDLFYASFYDDMATEEYLLNIIQDLPPEGVFEIMCHPGFSDDYLISSTIYAIQRDAELDVLTRSTIKQAVAGRQIELATFRQLT